MNKTRSGRGWRWWGAALDGIQDFDWQRVRDFVGAVTAEGGEDRALTAQVGFVSS